jgi:hypothetical protein
MSSEAAPRGASVRATVEKLVIVHGAADAAKLAMTEKRNARRARSRKRFDFWAAVLAEIAEDPGQRPM